MIRLKSMHLNGFRTFSGDQVVTFPVESGLYLMRGENCVDPSLMGNDVGKSSALDAIYWGLYGETTRGLRASNVISWGAKTAFVEQVWSINGKDVAIRRQQSPNGLWIDDRRVSSNDKIVETLGLSAWEFGHSVLAGQFSPYFLDLSASCKLDLFSDILQLSYWDNCADRARLKERRTEDKLSACTIKLSEAKAMLATLCEEQQKAECENARWEKELDRESQQLNYDIKALERRERKLVVKLDGERVRLLSATKASDDVRVLLADTKLSLSDSERQLADRKANMNKTECPFCGQKLGAAYSARLSSEVSKLKAQRDTLRSQLLVVRKKADRLTAKTDDSQSVVNRLSMKLAAVQGEQSSVRKRLVALSGESPFSRTLKRLSKSIDEAREQVRGLRGHRDGLRTMLGRYQYWSKGFRDLRLWLLDSTLAEQEMLTNNSLVQLGMDRWSVHYAVERENKAGGITRGFVVDVHSPESKDNVPWHGWGGGVTQRLRISAEIGLGKLITGHKHVELGTEFWDEPTQHLSERGVEDLLMHLHARSQSENRQIWIVDHRSLNYGFDGGLLVVKNKTGSEIRAL